MSSPDGLERTQRTVDQLVAEIMKRNAAERGYALAVARALIARLPSADARALKHPTPPDPAALVG
jgi:hypothetical protein